MSLELKQVAEQSLDLSTPTLREMVTRHAAVIDSRATLEDMPEALAFQIDMARALLREFAAIQQAEAQQPATGKPTPQDVVDAFEKARAGSDKPVGILRGVRAVMRLLPDLKPAPDPIAPATPEPRKDEAKRLIDTLRTDASGGRAATVHELDAAADLIEASLFATGEPVHQIRKAFTQDAEWAWRDATEEAFHMHPEKHRRILYTHPAPSVPKDDQIAALVNKVRDIARMFHDHQSLRERIAIELVPALKASQEVKSNAERWRYAIADGGNQSMNFIDIFGDWDGDGSFVEAFDKARLADKKEGSAA